MSISDRLNSFDNVTKLWDAMEETGTTRDPLRVDEWLRSMSPVRNGREAAHFQLKLANALVPQLIAKRLAQAQAGETPYVEPSKGVLIANEFQTGRPVLLALSTINKHVLIAGASGSGKTTASAILIAGMLGHEGITASLYDNKGEGTRFLNVFDSGVLLLRPDQELENLFEPIGNPEHYYWGLMAELGRCFSLRPETWTDCVRVLVRIHQGLKQGECSPSSVDVERVFLTLAARERNPKLATAAGVLAILNSTRGRAALVRRGPPDTGRNRLIIHEYVGLPPRNRSFYAGVRLLRTQMQISVAGRQSPGLKHGLFIDEAGLDFGKEMSQAASSGYISPHKRIITQLRSAGVGVVAGVQFPTQVDESLPSNVATFLCFRCPAEDARVACRWLGLPPEMAVEVQNLDTRVAYLRSEGYSRAIKVQLPFADLGLDLSADEVERRQAAEITWRNNNAVFGPSNPDNDRPLDYQELLGQTTAEPEDQPTVSESELRSQFLEEHRALLSEIAANPTASVTEHYAALSWSAYRGNRVKNQLTALGLIRSERQRSANGRPREILLLTDTGKSLHESTS